MAAMNSAVAALERYDYRVAFDGLRPLVRAHPRWLAARVNLGLAALNLQEKEYLRVAEESFRAALVIDPACAHAQVSLGILFRYESRLKEALAALEAAFAIDPEDPHILYLLGATLADLERWSEARDRLEDALRIQPSFASALYRLGTVYVRLGKDGRARRRELLRRFQELERAGVGQKVGNKYGEGGRYNLAIRSSAPPGVSAPPPRPRSDLRLAPPRMLRELPGRPRSSPPAFAVDALDSDSTLEVVFSGEELLVVSPGRDGSAIVRARVPESAILIALGDVDGDGDVDLLGAGESGLTLLANDGTAGFKRLEARGLDVIRGKPRRLGLVDFDSDWDLDVLGIVEDVESGSARVFALANLGDGTYRDITESSGLGDLDIDPVEMVFADLDGDIDGDLLVLSAGGEARVWANDLVWRFRRVDALIPTLPRGLRTVVGGYIDDDDDLDLFLLTGERLELWLGGPGLGFVTDQDFSRRAGALGGTCGVVFDFESSLESSLLVLDAKRPSGERAPALVRWDGSHQAVELDLSVLGLDHARASKMTAGSPLSALVAHLEVDDDGATGPDLVVFADSGRAARYRIESGGPWLTLDLLPSRGEEGVRPEPRARRSGSVGRGAKVEVRVGRRARSEQSSGALGGNARGSTRTSSGLGDSRVADAVRILWPDAVLQSEGDLAAGHHAIEELDRKPSSCPVLFAWNGESHEFVADFLGVGGVGYFEAPEQYGRPDPTELLLLPRLVERNGSLELRVLEPLEECTYLDQASLLVVDAPADRLIVPLEIFAVRAPRPEFELLVLADVWTPSRARDGVTGEDVTESLREIDGNFAPRLERDPRWPGVLARRHAIEFDLEGCESLLGGAGEESLWLVLHGFIEYGYSTTNFSAWQAGFVPLAPTVSVERGGVWRVVREDWGFPAGYPRWMAIDLEGLLAPGDRRVRIETNLEIQWDTVRMGRSRRIPATEGTHGPVTIAELAPKVADLTFRGFPGPANPNDRVEGFEYARFRPWEHYRALPGRFTRYGDVRELLRGADDRFVILGPGDEIALSFTVESAPPASTSARSFVWKCHGYCKDMDPYTARPEGVEPLPHTSFSTYPPPDDHVVPEDLLRDRERWNTRRVEASPGTTFREAFERGAHGSNGRSEGGGDARVSVE